MQTLLQLQNGELKGATSLTLSEGLTHFPEEIFELADTLEKLDLSYNNLSALPPDFGRLKKLKVFFCSENPFTVLPEVLADCPLLDIAGFKANNINTVPAKSLNPNLRWLILTNNNIAELPAEIGNCKRMQKLMLAGNQLTTLPRELSNCRNLELLRISANRLSELPQWLLQIPGLSWLAFSGNPFCTIPAVQPLDLIHWDELELNGHLGEGASGIISKASWRNATAREEVAIKIFKGAVTSDGSPEDEMNTCIAADVHPGLVQLVGQIKGHPEDKKGLVMGLIPPSFYNLGLPPSLQSCTRDVFRDTLTLSVWQIVKIAGTIASVAVQLHDRGIMHSDMYAHNTLIDDEANTLFGDFGAACFYDKNDSDLAPALERLEVRAFGCLLDDLLSLSNEQSNDTLAKLGIIRDACMVQDVLARPGFRYLDDELQKF
jgi:Protein tyrosine and serine/threonine kinase/Leucine rich repeat/Leucine Rich Repeat